MMMKEINGGSGKGESTKKSSGAATHCLQQTAEWLGVYGRLLDDLQRSPSGR